MKILHITPTFQHPKVRGSCRHYHFIRELSKAHEITLLTLERAPIAAEALEEMASYTKHIHTFKVNSAAKSQAARMMKRVPAIGSPIAQQIAVREGVAQMKQTFHRLVQQEKFDVVLFHGKDCFPVIDGWKELPIVTDFCDATSFRVRTQMRYVNPVKATALGLRYLQVRQVERKMVSRTRNVAFISHRDREVILGPHSNAEVIPNGIDLGYWTRRSHNPQPNCLIFTGIMSYAPNHDAAMHLIDHIMPRLRPLIPNLQLIIAGREPAAELRKRGEQFSDVTVTGFVDDMRDYMEKATVFVAPLRYASGMQNKIQEAFAMGVPVVTNSLVAEGLQVDENEHPPLYVADDDDTFARKVLDLLNHPSERVRLANEGRAFAEKHFVWSQSAKHLEEMCLTAMQYHN